MIKGKIRGRAALEKKLKEVAPSVVEASAKAKLEVAEIAAEKIENAAPLGETGDYRASITGERQANNPNQRAVGHKTAKDPDATGIYADWRWRFLEFGTAPHKIKAKNRPALVFQARDGKIVRTETVSHPGSARQPHIFPTWRAYKPKAMKHIRKVTNKVIREVLGK